MSTPPRRIIPREEVGDTDWQPLVFTAINDPTPPRMRRPEPAPAPAPAALAPAFTPVAQPEPVAAPEPVAEPVAAVPAPPPIDIQQAHAAELEAAMQQAHDAGFEAGHAEGLAAGHAEAEADVEGLRRVLHSLEHFTEQAGGELAENVLDLALVIAREITRTQVETDTQRLLPIVREMIETMPVLKPPARILAHPEDVTALESILGSELPTDTWKLVPDPSQEPGGCKVESSGARADLSLATRWQQQLRVLRRQDRDDLSWQAGKVEPPPAPAAQPAPEPSAAEPAAAAGPQPAPAVAAAEPAIAPLPPLAAEAASAAPAAAPADTAQASDALAQFDPHALNIAAAAPAAAANPATPAASGVATAYAPPADAAVASAATQPAAAQAAAPQSAAAGEAAAAVAATAPVAPVIDTNG
ncbi:hypothetical protein JCM19000A_40420 [Silvimonas sp. JCM 19000]